MNNLINLESNLVLEFDQLNKIMESALSIQKISINESIDIKGIKDKIIQKLHDFVEFIKKIATGFAKFIKERIVSLITKLSEFVKKLKTPRNDITDDEWNSIIDNINKNNKDLENTLDELRSINNKTDQSLNNLKNSQKDMPFEAASIDNNRVILLHFDFNAFGNVLEYFDILNNINNESTDKVILGQTKFSNENDHINYINKAIEDIEELYNDITNDNELIISYTEKNMRKYDIINITEYEYLFKNCISYCNQMNKALNILNNIANITNMTINSLQNSSGNCIQLQLSYSVKLYSTCMLLINKLKPNLRIVNEILRITKDNLKVISPIFFGKIKSEYSFEESASLNDKEFDKAAIEGIKSKYNIKDSDVTAVKGFLKRNPDVSKSLSKCKSTSDIRKLMSSKEFKTAVKEDNEKGKSDRDTLSKIETVSKITLYILMIIWYLKLNFKPKSIEESTLLSEDSEESIPVTDDSAEQPDTNIEVVPESNNTSMLVVLNSLLIVYCSNFSVLHWNSVGEEFNDAHRNIAEEYEELCHKYIDPIAEMVTRLGSNPLNYVEVIELMNSSERKCLIVDSKRLYTRKDIIEIASKMFTDIVELLSATIESEELKAPINAGIRSELESILNDFDLQYRYINKRRLSIEN